MTPAEQDPADCFWCSRHAIGIGIGNMRKPTDDPKWICAECVPIMEFIKSVRRRTPYELKARQGGMDAAGPLIAEFGSDLAEYTEEQALRLCGAIWQGCADRMRELIRGGDAPW